MEMNKIAAAILLAGIIAMVAGLASQMLYHGGLEHGSHEEAHRGYTIAVPESGEGEGAEEVVDAEPEDATPYLAAADIEAGEKLLKRCTTCHTFTKGGSDGVGPNNYGIVGKNMAHASGYAYSDAMKAMHGSKWTFQAMFEFLEKPKKYIPGNKMAFAGLKKPQDRANLIAYINTLSDSPQPLPTK